MAIFDRLRRRLHKVSHNAGTVDAAWREGEAYAKEAFERIAASFVASWEVAAAELYRKARQTRPKDETNVIVNRFSDGLVPTMDGLSAVSHQLPGAWRIATTEHANIDARLVDIDHQLAALPTATAEGWKKTVAYVDEAFASFDTSKAGGLEAIGPALSAILTSEINDLLQQLRGIETAPRPEQALITAFLRFGDAACRGIEIELDAVRAYIQSLD